MTKNNPKPNDFVTYEERVKKTIRNMEAAEEAMKFADGKELEAIKKKNERREESIWGTSDDNDNQQKK